MIKEEPGFEFWEMDDYVSEFGDLATNGMLSNGHRSWEMDDVGAEGGW